MADDHVVDTNVLVLGSAGESGDEAGEASPVPEENKWEVFEWLVGFQSDPKRKMVLDEGYSIWKEYLRRLSEQDLGLLVIREKIQTARWHTIDMDKEGDASLPAALAAIVHDRSDRKFVAVALADGGRSSIVNACDTDWLSWEDALEMAGVEVKQLLKDWCLEKRRQKEPG